MYDILCIYDTPLNIPDTKHKNQRIEIIRYRTENRTLYNINDTEIINETLTKYAKKLKRMKEKENDSQFSLNIVRDFSVLFIRFFG